MLRTTGFRLKSGENLLDPEYIQKLRDDDRKSPNPLKIIAQSGGQENMLTSDADIIIGGGSRGGSKTFSLLLEALRDINNPNFMALVLRNERDDLLDIINTSYRIYSQFGTYNKSISDMTWYFKAGGKMKFSYYADSFEDFKKRFQGKQYSYIAIDEITHSEYRKFKYLVTCNRNAAGIRNRFWGTCNPDPDSWVRTFIDWWIGDDGLPVQERSGKKRYCFMDGDSPTSIYWGDTPEQVYGQCRHIIDPLWNDKYAELGFNRMTMFIKSVAFVRASLEDNIKLITSDPNYAANLAQQDTEQRERDLLGNWNYKNAGDDMLSMEDMEKMFANSEQTGDQHRYASCDIAFEGGDNLVLWLWIGNHVEDVFVCRNDAKTALALVAAKLSEWGVLQKDFVYDLNGLGQTFRGFFPDAMPFNNLEAPVPTSQQEKDSVKYMYGNIKSQCAYLLVRDIKNGDMSVNNKLLSRKFSGKGYNDTPLRDILMRERKCLRKNDDRADKGFTLIGKKVMKKYVGHSPDFMESWIFRKVFDIKRRNKRPTGLWMI